MKVASAETVHVILLPLLRISSGSRMRSKSQQEAIFSWMAVLKGSKRLQPVLEEAKYDGQSRQEAKNWHTCLYPVVNNCITWQNYFLSAIGLNPSKKPSTTYMVFFHRTRHTHHSKAVVAMTVVESIVDWQDSSHCNTCRAAKNHGATL